MLDNCEHLLSPCAQLANVLLRACPTLRILATSREALGITGETAYRLPSLSLPDVASMPVERLAQYEAVQLFIDRAAAVLPSFKLTTQNAQAVATICQRLDGIPLPVELAAVRVKAMSVEHIAERLQDRFKLLTGGSRTAMPRQQTLRAALHGFKRSRSAKRFPGRDRGCRLDRLALHPEGACWIRFTYVDSVKAALLWPRGPSDPFQEVDDGIIAETPSHLNLPGKSPLKGLAVGLWVGNPVVAWMPGLTML